MISNTEKRLAIVMALLFLFFAVPKLTAADVSLALFDKINGYMGWQGRWFMYMTGVLELAVGSLLLAVLAVKEKGKLLGPFGLYTAGYTGTIGTMLGALFVELSIRPGEDMILTVLAFVLLAGAGYLLWLNKPHLPIVGQGRIA